MPETPLLVYLCLGSNLGDRLGYLRAACEALPRQGIRLTRASSLYETEPVDFPDQGWFLNCVIEAETTLPPSELLGVAQEIENALGRRRDLPQGPRTIDIDILLYGKQVLDSDDLVIPHPRMLRRRFVLMPLRELAPALSVPTTTKTVAEQLEALQDNSRVIRLSQPSLF